MRTNNGCRYVFSLLMIGAASQLFSFQGCHAAPVTPSAVSSQVQAPARVLPGTGNCTRIWIPLWTSPTDLLRWDSSLSGEMLLNVQTGHQEPLVAVNALIKQQAGFFNPFAVRLSPDGKWLLWPSVSQGHPTWTATTLDGSQRREWTRYSQDDMAQVAWMRDSTHWVELSQTPFGTGEALSRVYSINTPEVQEFPLQLASLDGTLTIWPPASYNQFSFTADGRAWITQMWSGATSPSNPQIAGSRADLYEIIPGPESWTLRKRVVFPGAYQDVGAFDECVMSPDGDWLAWRNYNADGTGPMRFALSRVDGSEMQTVFQAPSASGYLQWAPDGQKIVFYSWDHNSSMFLLPLTSTEAKRLRSVPSRVAGRTQPRGKFPTKAGDSWLDRLASK